MKDLLIATKNQGKVAEFGRLLTGVPATLRDLTFFGITDEVEETGVTFEENAAIKASAYARIAGLSTLADDSGLLIDQLNGAPGVRSARYAGEDAKDEDRVEKILQDMRGIPDARRTARFVCITTLASEDGEILYSTEGICEGVIATAAKGRNGFGYDPIFVPDGYRLTFAELTPDVKDKISHRARAVEKIIPFLHGFFES